MEGHKLKFPSEITWFQNATGGYHFTVCPVTVPCVEGSEDDWEYIVNVSKKQVENAIAYLQSEPGVSKSREDAFKEFQNQEVKDAMLCVMSEFMEEQIQFEQEPVSVTFEIPQVTVFTELDKSSPSN